MGKVTGISWTDHTFNPWIGCTKASPGCANCYAESLSNFHGWVKWGKGQPRKRTSAANWREPLKWAKAAIKDGVIRRVFCASLGDILDPEVPEEWRQELWQLIMDCANPEMFDVYGSGLEWLLLTKHAENLSMLPEPWRNNPPNWIRVGITAENQEWADRRLPLLFETWQGNNFVSVEPMIGPVTFVQNFCRTCENGKVPYSSLDGYRPCPECDDNPGICKIDWVICGGESGAQARPMEIAWALELQRQCGEYATPFFMKQLGGHPNKRHNLEDFPEDLRVREFPE